MKYEYKVIEMKEKEFFLATFKLEDFIPNEMRTTTYIPINLIPSSVEKPRCNAHYIYVFRLDWNQIL